jgi:hypothetical protein
MPIREPSFLSHLLGLLHWRKGASMDSSETSAESRVSVQSVQ